MAHKYLLTKFARKEISISFTILPILESVVPPVLLSFFSYYPKLSIDPDNRQSKNVSLLRRLVAQVATINNNDDNDKNNNNTPR